MTLNSLIQKDEELSRSLRVLQDNKKIKPFAAVFAHSGDSWFWLAGLILVVIFGENYWKTWSLILSGSILALAVFVLSLKFLIRRRRPEGEWGQIYRATDPHSFPSGHAFSAFLLTYILKKYSNVDISIIPYLVGFSRVYLGVHYPTDIIGGFLLSKIIIKLFLTD